MSPTGPGRGRAVGPARAGMFRWRSSPPRSPSCRPRTRGDVPPTRLARAPRETSAPHARGCSRVVALDLAEHVVGPARAGMFLCSWSARAGRDRRPRTRGDVPKAGLQRYGRYLSAPHARGCSDDGAGRPALPRVGPARAGMFRTPSDPDTKERRRPRTRGDVPSWMSVRWVGPLSAPHARGCSRGLRDRRRDRRVGPARAGMFPGAPVRARHRGGRPRTRGDVPRAGWWCRPCRRSAPHARGCSHLRGGGRRGRRVGSARAGMFPPRTPAAGGFWRRPRTRGDVPEAQLAYEQAVQSAPHARGCSPELLPQQRGARVGPARAGMFRSSLTSRTSPRGRPRTRGDVPLSNGEYVLPAKSAPHARGCSVLLDGGLAVGEVNLAHAGCFPSDHL